MLHLHTGQFCNGGGASQRASAASRCAACAVCCAVLCAHALRCSACGSDASEHAQSLDPPPQSTPPPQNTHPPFINALCTVYLFVGTSLNATPSQLGTLTLCRALVQTLASPLSGVLGDRCACAVACRACAVVSGATQPSTPLAARAAALVVGTIEASALASGRASALAHGFVTSPTQLNTTPHPLNPPHPTPQPKTTTHPGTTAAWCWPLAPSSGAR